MKPAEHTYINCLLTTLARGTAESVFVTYGLPPPDPAQLTTDPTDLRWIAEFGFKLDRLSTRLIVDSILRAAGFRWYRPSVSEGYFNATLLPHDGNVLSDIAFRVWRLRDEIKVASIQYTDTNPAVRRGDRTQGLQAYRGAP